MGMFDYLRCDLPLPIGQDWLYQTKDTDSQCLMSHTITAEGRLMLHDYELEETPKDELPYAAELAAMEPGDQGRALYEMCGCIRPKAGTERDVDQLFDGDLYFYPDVSIDDDVDYRATFRDGCCVEICMKSDGRWRRIFWRDSDLQLTAPAPVGQTVTAPTGGRDA